MNTTTVVLYALLGIYILCVVIGAIVEGYKMISSANWVVWGGALLFFIAFLVVASSYWTESSSTTTKSNTTPVFAEDDDNNDDDTSDTPGFIVKAVGDLELVDEHEFALKQTDGSQPTKSDEVSPYENLKRLIKDPTFITQFSDSILQSMKMKKKKYIKMYSEYTDQLNQFEKKDDLFGNMGIQKLRNEQAQTLQDNLNRVQDILKTIRERITQITPSDTAKRLNIALFKKEVGLDTIVGRDDIKNFIASRLITFAKNPKIFFESFQNIILMAGPGAGKTRIATTIAHVFACSGILVDDRIIVTTKEGLVSAYVNESAKKTHSFMLTTLEKVAFIDEAYDITPPQGMLGSMHRDHGYEAVTQMVNDMDKMIGLHIIIAGGYEKDMKDRFLAANEGMPRRFPHQVTLPPYSSKELATILVDTLHQTTPELEWTSDIDNYLYTLVHQIYSNNTTLFANQAGDIKNLSSDISHSIYNASDPWPVEWKKPVLEGVNHYLSNKKVKLVEE
jgi:hypothetical protein